MAQEKKTFKKISKSKVQTFKIKNRKGFAAICMDNLTEGATVGIVMERMNKALKRSGYALLGDHE